MGLFRKAEHLLLHPEELLALLGHGLKRAYDKRKALLHVFEELLVMIRLVKAWVLGEYKEPPRRVIFWAVVAILYFLSPLDAIPDILPGGYLDDILVISFVVKKIQGDLDKFQEWEKQKKEKA